MIRNLKIEIKHATLYHNYNAIVCILTALMKVPTQVQQALERESKDTSLWRIHIVESYERGSVLAGTGKKIGKLQ